MRVMNGNFEFQGAWRRVVHTCKECKVELDETGSNFRIQLNKTTNRRYYMGVCRRCDNARNKKRTTRNSAYKERRKEKIKETYKNRRAINDPYFVYRSCREADRLSGNTFDMDMAFVKDSIEKGCSYCSIGFNQGVKIGLDRIDNSKGHSKDNVQPCCVRCNLIRKDMPYPAWLIVAKAMKEALSLGLFGTWFPGSSVYMERKDHGVDSK